MMTGEVKGIMLNQKAIWLFGSCMALTMTTMASMRGTVMGSCRFWVSFSLSTALPTAANMAA